MRVGREQLLPTTVGHRMPAGELCAGNVLYGVCEKRARKNEDRWVVTPCPTYQQRDGTPVVWADAVAGVFDGHNGQGAAEACVRCLVQFVGEEHTQLLQEAGKDSADGVVWSTLVCHLPWLRRGLGPRAPPACG